MTERRLRVDTLPHEGGTVTLDADAAHHARVLRLSVGDEVVLFDGHGGRANGTVLSLSPTLTCEAAPRQSLAITRPIVHLVQALPRAGKLDDLLRMVTEVGVAVVHLVATERSVARIDAERDERRRERWARVVSEAARQCERDDVPEIFPPGALDDVARRAPSDAARLVACGRTGTSWPDRTEARETWIVVGPEGGLSPEEVASLSRLGYRSVKLGDTVLRVETAAPVAVALALDWMRRSADL